MNRELKAYQSIESRKKIQEEKKEKRHEEFKCNGCVWGRWNEVSYVCLFPECMKGYKVISKR